MKHIDFDDKARTFTPAQFAQAAADALDNWDWSIESAERSLEYAVAMKESLDFGDDAVDYAANNWAEDDGLIHLGKGDKDIWDKLYEFAVSTADNALQ